ncbi:MAG: hypothetical protein ACR2PR_07475 [Pseudohongiellaceae bacterium]
MRSSNTCRLVGGDRAGTLLTNGMYYEGDTIRLPAMPSVTADMAKVDPYDIVTDTIDMVVYQVHHFSENYDQDPMAFAAPEGWTAMDIQMELWRKYSDHEEMTVEVEASDREQSTDPELVARGKS